jgi:hypothetical protein
MTKAMKSHGSEDHQSNQERKQDDVPVEREAPEKRDRHRTSLGQKTLPPVSAKEGPARALIQLHTVAEAPDHGAVVLH